MIISGGQQKDSAIHIHISIVPQTPLPSRLPCNIEQSSMCYGILVMHLKYSSVYMPIPNSLTIPAPSIVPHTNNHKLILKVCESVS